MTAAEHPLSPEDVMAYLDGELPAEQAAVVQAHVTGCEECQRLSVELRGVSRDMARWQVENAPPTLRAPWPPTGSANRPRSRFAWLLWLAPAYALAALALVGIAIVGAYNSMSMNPMVRVTPVHDPEAKVLTYPTRLDTEGSSPMSAAMPAEPPVQYADTMPPGVVAGRISMPRVAAQPTLGPSIARTASLRLSSRDFEATRRAVERIAGEMGGWFGHIDVSRTGRGRSLKAALQVPAPRLDAALAALKPLGIVLNESQQGEDVTAQIVDVDARLSNARNTEKRLVDLLQKRTGELEHVLAAEREIARVREEIERFDAQRKNLGRRVTYATLTLEVVEETQATLDLGPRPVPRRFRDAFVTGLTEAVETALGLALFIVGVAPSLVLWVAILAWPARRLMRWNRRRMNPEP